jgi:hypothetical protein
MKADEAKARRTRPKRKRTRAKERTKEERRKRPHLLAPQHQPHTHPDASQEADPPSRKRSQGPPLTNSTASLRSTHSLTTAPPTYQRHRYLVNDLPSTPSSTPMGVRISSS